MRTFCKLVLTSCLLLIFSCDKNNDDVEVVNILVPQFISFENLRQPAIVTTGKPVVESGKIYVKENLVLVNDVDQGIHVIDNSNPQVPQKIAFIEIPGNRDIEVKGTILYADSYVDLVVFDISNLSNITELKRLENVLNFYPTVPVLENAWVDYEAFGNGESQGVHIGWEVRQELRKIQDANPIFIGFEDFAQNEALPATGQGGSMARFKIVDDYLYAVDHNHINIFNIQNLNEPQALEDVYAGFLIETIFNKGNHLFLGSQLGMFIFDITTPATPQYVSEFQHARMCDPVVVDGQYAFITLRGGNVCNGFEEPLESRLDIVNIENIENPQLEATYPMEEPYGLGTKGNLLFICDGDAGLKVYNKEAVGNLELVNHFEDVSAFDVIPMESHLLLIGNSVLSQYSYVGNGIELLSVFSLN